MAKVIISVYLKSGQVFEYEVDSMNKAREHMYKIWKSGYRTTSEGSLEWFGKHWIDKIKATPIKSEPFPTKHPDTTTGT